MAQIWGKHKEINALIQIVAYIFPIQDVKTCNEQVKVQLPIISNKMFGINLS